MGVAAHPDPRPAEEEPLTLRRLLPPGDPATVQEIVESLDLHVAGADIPEATREGTPTTPAKRPYKESLSLALQSTCPSVPMWC